MMCSHRSVLALLFILWICRDYPCNAEATEWIDYSPFFCGVERVRSLATDVDEEQCKNLCGQTCKGVVWWENDERSCKECLSLAVREQYTHADDPAYPPHVFGKKASPVLSPDHPMDTMMVENANSTLSLQCVISFGHPEPNVSWEKVGQLGSLGNETILRLRQIKSAAGRYRCVVTNALGSMASREAIVVVQYPPTIIEHPKSQVVEEGAEVTLRCRTTGILKPNVTWTKIEDRGKSFPLGEILTFDSVRGQDTGTYECNVSNSVGDPVYGSAHILVTDINDPGDTARNKMDSRDIIIILVSLSVALLFLTLLVLTIGCCLYRRKKKQQQQHE